MNGRRKGNVEQHALRVEHRSVRTTMLLLPALRRCRLWVSPGRWRRSGQQRRKTQGGGQHDRGAGGAVLTKAGQEHLELADVGYRYPEQEAVLADEVVCFPDIVQGGEISGERVSSGILAGADPDERLQPAADRSRVDDGPVLLQDPGLFQAPDPLGGGRRGQVHAGGELSVAQPRVGLQLDKQRHVRAVQFARHSATVTSGRQQGHCTVCFKAIAAPRARDVRSLFRLHCALGNLQK